MGSFPKHAEQIGANAEGYGFAPAILIPIAEYVLPKLLKCWLESLATGGSADEHASTLKKIAETNWVPALGRYSDDILERMRPQTQHAIIVKTRRRATIDECNRVSASILDHARSIDESEIKAAVNEVCPVLATIKIDPSV